MTAFLIFEIVFTGITAPFIVYFGPFNNLKSTLVGSIYSTLSHRYMVDTFLAQDAIERIIGKQGYYATNVPKTESIKDQTTVVNISNNHSDKVEVVKIDGTGIKGYMIIISDPTKVKVGYSSKLPTMGESTSTIAKNNKALAAINAGGFSYNDGWSSIGDKYEGYIIHNGKVVGNSHNNDDVKDDAIGLTAKGELVFGKYSANELLEGNVKEAITFFGPQLIVKGRRVFNYGEDGGLGLNPRTAIAQKANGDIIFLVIDGRNIFGLGASVYDVQEILYANVAVNAIALDGGSSSTMYYNGKVINNVSNPMGERVIPSVFMMVPDNGGSGK
jgi:exopolysaccharide biosynthesis protein